jgi:hypothetical protein
MFEYVMSDTFEYLLNVLGIGGQRPLFKKGRRYDIKRLSDVNLSSWRREEDDIIDVYKCEKFTYKVRIDGNKFEVDSVEKRAT